MQIFLLNCLNLYFDTFLFTLLQKYSVVGVQLNGSKYWSYTFATNKLLGLKQQRKVLSSVAFYLKSANVSIHKYSS